MNPNEFTFFPSRVAEASNLEMMSFSYFERKKRKKRKFTPRKSCEKINQFNMPPSKVDGVTLAVTISVHFLGS